jgi:hypothetical protein
LITSALNYEDYFNTFWDVIYTRVTWTGMDQTTALEYFADYLDAVDDTDEVAADEDTDEAEVRKADEREVRMMTNARLFEVLWPLAQQAQGIIDHHWSSVERLASDLLKTRSLGREEIEARLPWAGHFVVSKRPVPPARRLVRVERG